MKVVLYYVHDPMCSWCWGYRPTWEKLKAALPAEIPVINVLGGLAADDDQPMPPAMRQAIEGHWHHIQSLLGTRFNFEFWSHCQPRRDTYKACRAVVLAAAQGLEEEMIKAIQQAYYLHAMNPSEPEVLTRLAGEIGMDQAAFETALVSRHTDNAFRRQRRLARRLGVRSYPSLVIKTDQQVHPVTLDYHDPQVSLDDIFRLLPGNG